MKRNKKWNDTQVLVRQAAGFLSQFKTRTPELGDGGHPREHSRYMPARDTWVCRFP